MARNPAASSAFALHIARPMVLRFQLGGGAARHSAGDEDKTSR
jgi:hypothetical protein